MNYWRNFAGEIDLAIKDMGKGEDKNDLTIMKWSGVGYVNMSREKEDMWLPERFIFSNSEIANDFSGLLSGGGRYYNVD